MLSDKDIIEAMNNGDIKIEPFEKGCLTAVGYDFRLGATGFSLTKQQEIDIAKTKGIKIAPHEMVIVSSKEVIYLSKKISGTIHAQVKRLNEGLQAISATADPDWHGPARLHLTNNLDKSVFIPIESTIATICFYKLNTPTELDSPEPHQKTVDWNKLLAASQDKKEKSWKYKLFSTKLRYLLALFITVIISIVAYYIFQPKPDSFAGIIAVISVLSLYLIEFLK